MSADRKSRPLRDHLFSAADRSELEEERGRHPYNPNSDVRGHRLGVRTGLERVGVNLLRIPPGKESFAFHAHLGEEEFVYVLAGRGVAEIGDQSFEIGAGDFLGFPASGPGHLLRDPFDADLVYLSGGETRDLEVADFPRLGRRMVRAGTSVTVFPMDAALPFAVEG